MSAYERIQWLHERLKNSSYPNAKRISEKFQISHRQGQRDIFFIKNNLGAPIEYNFQNKGYYYETDFNLPFYMTTEQDFLDYTTDIEKDPSLSLKKSGSENKIIQMQFPESATIELQDRLALYEIERYIISKKINGNSHIVYCNFNNASLFLSSLLTCGFDFKIVEPIWLKDHLKEMIFKAIKNNEIDLSSINSDDNTK